MATPTAIEVGYDAAKKVKGCKRHLLVDTLGFMLMVVVNAASVPQRAGGKLVFARLERVRQWVNRLVLIWMDGGYQGQDFRCFVMDMHRWIVEAGLEKDDIKRVVVVLPISPISCRPINNSRTTLALSGTIHYQPQVATPCCLAAADDLQLTVILRMHLQPCLRL